MNATMHQPALLDTDPTITALESITTALKTALTAVLPDVIRQAKAEAWDEGRAAGADMGISIGERIVGTRSDWPAVPKNPYRAEVEAGAAALYGDGWEHADPQAEGKYHRERACEVLNAAWEVRHGRD